MKKELRAGDAGKMIDIVSLMLMEFKLYLHNFIAY